MAENPTDPGDRSVSELEREVNQERESLSSTIDALKEKASIGNVFDQVVKIISESGGEIGRNLGRTVRDHPLPALLAGVGLVWLMASSGRPPYRSEWDDDFEDEDYFRRFGGTPPNAERAHTGSSYAAGDTYAERTYAGSGVGDEALYQPGDEEGGPGIRERANEAAEGLRERAADFAARAQERLSSASHRVRSAGGSVRGRARETGRYALHAGHDARESVDRMMHEQPLVLGALALALGAAVGGALPRSQTEDRMFGARALRARQSLRSMAEEQGRKVEATAGAVAEEAQAIAGEAARELSESLPSGQELVEKAEHRLSDAAARLREAGAAEADRQRLDRPPTGE